MARDVFDWRRRRCRSRTTGTTRRYPGGTKLDTFARPGGGGGYAVSPFSGSVDHRNFPEGLSNPEQYMVHLDEVKRVKPKADISLKQLPVLVRLGDPNSPTNMSLVDPLNLADAFGSGVELKAATVEVTDDQITHSIESRLPWLKQNRLPKFDDLIFPPPSPGFERDKSEPPNFRYSAFIMRGQ
jgi:hypothetical protein